MKRMTDMRLLAIGTLGVTGALVVYQFFSHAKSLKRCRRAANDLYRTTGATPEEAKARAGRYCEAPGSLSEEVP